MKIKYEVKIEDLVHHGMYYYLTSKLHKKIVLSYIIYTIFILAIFSLVAYLKENLDIDTIILMLFFLIFIFVFLPKFIMNSQVTTYRKALGQCNVALGIFELSLEEDGIYDKGELSEVKYRWKSITEIVDEEDYLMILLGDMKAFIVNKSSLIEGDLESFTKELKLKVN